MGTYHKYLDFLDHCDHDIGDRHSRGDGLVSEITLLSEFIASTLAIDSSENYDKKKDSTAVSSVQCLECYYYLGPDVNNFDIVLLDDFPVEMVKKYIQYFINNKNCGCAYTEIIKYVYKYWDNNKIKTEVDEIKKILADIANTNPVDYNNILTNCANPEYHYRRYHIFYPLLENYEELILKLVSFTYLSNAQDYLLDGIYLMDSSKLKHFYKKLLVALEENLEHPKRHCFNPWRTESRAFSQNIKIIKKLKDTENYDLLTDEDLKEYLIKHKQIAKIINNLIN